MGKKRKEIENEIMLKKLNGLTFFSFLGKIFHNLFSSLYFQNNNDKRHCLRSIPKVSNETKFLVIFYVIKKNLLWVKMKEKVFSILYFIFLMNEEKEFRKSIKEILMKKY